MKPKLSEKPTLNAQPQPRVTQAPRASEAAKIRRPEVTAPNSYSGRRSANVTRGFSNATDAPRTGRRGGYSYTQKTYVDKGTSRVQRTYVKNNRTVVKNYNTYISGGHPYYAYAPVVVHDASFYSYLYHPWVDPYPYSWGWSHAAWYPHVGYYYRPYPVYYGPSYWLTDYLMGGILEDRYCDEHYRAEENRVAAEQANRSAANAEARADDAVRRANEAELSAARAQAAASTAGEIARLTSAANANANAEPARAVIQDDIKDQIKSQVEAAIQAHEKKLPVNVQEVITDTKHIFVVTDDLQTTLVDSTDTCTLTAGDLIRAFEVPANDAVVATMVVVTAKKGNCPAGSKVLVAMTDLQEFQNQFMEKLEEGMEKMKTEVKDVKK